MLKIISNLFKSPIGERLSCQALQTSSHFPNIIGVSSTYFHIISRTFGRKSYVKLPKKDEGTTGAHSTAIDNLIKRSDFFPDINTPDKLFNGIPFKQIPIVNIKATPNNTLMTLTNAAGVVKICHTCGAEGFKNSKKGTNVAAQSAAITLSSKALRAGYKTIRVRVRGLGPGRLASLQGLKMGGMEIISITDYTPVTWTPLRPRKARRV